VCGRADTTGLLVPATIPLRDHLEEADLSHISEIVDAEP
jgi:hypothetical protein